MSATANMGRAQRFGFSRSDIDDNALIMLGHPLLEENTARV
jgi:hypothetical protein